MSLVKCPTCGRQVSDSAEKCIYCGAVLPVINITGIVDDMFREYVNSPHEVLEARFRGAMMKIVKYLNSLYDGETSSNIFMAFLSRCFAADGVLSTQEYKLLADMLTNGNTKTTYTYDKCVANVQYFLDTGIDEMEKIIENAPPSICEAVVTLCLSVVAIDGHITPEESKFCIKYINKVLPILLRNSK